MKEQQLSKDNARVPFVYSNSKNESKQRISIIIDEHGTVVLDVNKIANLHCIAKVCFATLYYGGVVLTYNEFELVWANGSERLVKITTV